MYNNEHLGKRYANYLRSQRGFRLLDTLPLLDLFETTITTHQMRNLGEIKFRSTFDLVKIREEMGEIS